jgi:DNA-binding NarL/FixJ family response regulator
MSFTGRSPITVSRVRPPDARHSRGARPLPASPAPQRPSPANEAPAKARILLAGRHALVLEGLRRLLEDDFEVVACVPDGDPLIAGAVEHLPDAVVTEVSAPEASELELVRRLKAAAPRARVVVLASHAEPRLAAKGFGLGADGWLLKSSTVDELRSALRRALEGRRYLTRQIADGDVEALLDRGSQRAGEGLSPREWQVLKLVAEGMLMKQVAGALGIATRTVAFHKYRAMDKLGIRSNAELVRFALHQAVV